MIALSIFQSIEFYVIAAAIAAAIVAACIVPSDRGPVRTFLFAGILTDPASETTPPSGQGIVAQVDDSGYLVIYRFGLEGVYGNGAYSLAVKIAGFDVTVEERLTPGIRSCPLMTQAHAVLDCFGAERYHFRYNSEATGRSAFFTLNIRPGNKITRELTL